MSSLPSTVDCLFFFMLLILIREIRSTDITFKELQELNVTCPDINSCQKRVDNEIVSVFSCHCDTSCSKLGTCCLDYPYRERDPIADISSCRFVKTQFQQKYYMIDKCPYIDGKSAAFQSQCEEQNTEGDLMSHVPVTSLSSGQTYKNYFCFRCHEASDEYFFWNVLLKTSTAFNRSHLEEVIPTYNKEKGKWYAPIGENSTLYPVDIEMDAPQQIQSLLKPCSSQIISNCAVGWPKDEIRQKCSIYMFPIGMYPYKTYKNPHCALCNFEVLEGYTCDNVFVIQSTPERKKPFSFTHLLDINRSDGEKVGKIERCDGSSVWDPFFKKCRKLICALPGYTVKDGKCSAT